MTNFIGVLNSLAPLVALLMGSGLLVKYVPFLSKVPNAVIPFLNALITFLAAFGATPAHAGILGDVGHELGLAAKIAASLAISSFASVAYETFLRHPLAQLGLKKA